MDYGFSEKRNKRKEKKKDKKKFPYRLGGGKRSMNLKDDSLEFHEKSK